MNDGGRSQITDIFRDVEAVSINYLCSQSNCKGMLREHEFSYLLIGGSTKLQMKSKRGVGTQRAQGYRVAKSEDLFGVELEWERTPQFQDLETGRRDMPSVNMNKLKIRNKFGVKDDIFYFRHTY
jgi:hypothetical protein